MFVKLLVKLAPCTHRSEQSDPWHQEAQGPPFQLQQGTEQSPALKQNHKNLNSNLRVCIIKSKFFEF